MEFNSVDCGAGIHELYKWLVIDGEYECVGYDKHAKTQKYVSYDNGVTYVEVEPAEYGIGDLIEKNSADCGYEPSIEYRWVNLDPSTDFYCDECNIKVSGLKDNGETFAIVCDSSSSITQTEIQSVANVSYASIGSCVTNIDDLAFAGSTIDGINMGSSVTRIGNRAFYGCTNLQGIIIPDSVTTIGESAFTNCITTSIIVIPDSVTNIGDSAFKNCDNFLSVHIPSNLVSIPKDCFRDCGALSEVAIPNNVTSIGNSAFNGCISLFSVTIGNNITSIGDYAFNGCANLSAITINATTPPTLGINALNNTNNCLIYVPCESINLYKIADEWYKYRDRIHGISPCEEPPTPPLLSVTYGITSSITSNDKSLVITVKDDDGFEKTVVHVPPYAQGGIYNIPGTSVHNGYLADVDTLNSSYIKENNYTILTEEGHTYTIVVKSKGYNFSLYVWK